MMVFPSCTRLHFLDVWRQLGCKSRETRQPPVAPPFAFSRISKPLMELTFLRSSQNSEMRHMRLCFLYVVCWNCRRAETKWSIGETRVAWVLQGMMPQLFAGEMGCILLAFLLEGRLICFHLSFLKLDMNMESLQCVFLLNMLWSKCTVNIYYIYIYILYILYIYILYIYIYYIYIIYILYIYIFFPCFFTF